MTRKEVGAKGVGMSMVRTFRLLLLLLLPALAVALAGCGGPPGAVIRLGTNLQAQETQYGKDLRAKPGDPVALARLGAVELKLGKHRQAVRHLGEAARLDPANPEFGRWHADALLAAKRPVEAYFVYKRVLDLDPEYGARYEREAEPKLFVAFAESVERGKRVSRVLSLVRKLDSDALSRNPKAASRLFEAEGDRRFGVGSNHRARKAYERAASFGHGSSELPLKLGRVHAVLRQIDQARQHFDRWIASDPSKRKKRLETLAAFLETRFLFDLARHYLTLSLADEPGNRPVLKRLGTVLLKARKPAEAQKLFARFLKGQKGAGPQVEVARIYLKYRQTDKAIAHWRLAIAAAPTNTAQWRVLARVLRNAGRLGELEAIISQPDHHAGWGGVWAELGEWKKAAARYTKALQQPGVDAGVWLLLGEAQHRLRKSALRDKALASYVRTATDRKKALTAVASLYERLRASREAMAAWKELAALDPSRRDVAFAIARLSRSRREYPSEQAALAAWAKGQKDAAARARAWLEVARYYVRHRSGGPADTAIGRALAQGQTPHRREALFEGAQIHRLLLRSYGRAEELYVKWIDAAPQPKRFDARRRVASLIRGVRSMRRFRNRLLEELVRERPGEARTYFTLAESYLATRPQQRREAKRALERFIEKSKDPAAAILEAGSKLSRHNAYLEASQIYAKLSIEEIADPKLHLALGNLYMRSAVNDKRRAREHFNRYLSTVGEVARSAVSELYRLAGRLMSHGMHDVAVAIFRRILPLERNKTRVLRPLGEALLGMGNDADADEVFKSYLEAMGSGHQAVKRVADAFYQHGFYRRARVYYQSIFTERMRPRLSRYFPRLVDTYLKLGDKAGLLAICKRYVTLSPNARANGEAARKLKQAGLLKEAAAFLGTAAGLARSGHVYREQQADIVLQLGELDEAVRLLRLYISTQRGKPSAWVRAGQLLSDRGHDDRALALYDEVLATSPAGGQIHLARGQIRLRAGKVDDAHRDFVEALNRAENLDTALAEIRRVYVRAGQLGRLIDLLRRTVVLYPSRPETYLDLGVMALRLGRADEARQSFSRYAERQSKGLVAVAAHLWQAGDLNAAARYYERALAQPHLEGRARALISMLAAIAGLGLPERIPVAIQRFLVASENPSADVSTLALALASAGHLKRAIRFYERALKRGGNPSGWLQLGGLWLQLGDLGRAKRAFGRYVSGGRSGRQARRRARRRKPSTQRADRLRETAQLYERAGHFDRAESALLEALRTHPQIAGLHVRLARVRLAGGNVLGALDSLEALAGQRTVGPLGPGDIDAVYELLVRLGREREALEILARTPATSRSLPLSMALVRLGLRLGQTAAAKEEISRVLAQSELGSTRMAIARAHFDAGQLLEAADQARTVLEPGRGTSEVPAAVRLLLVVGRLRGDPQVVADVAGRLARVFEDRQQYHRVMTEGLMASGYHEAAVEHAADWVAATGKRPTGRALLPEVRPNPWRSLVLAHLRRGSDAKALRAARQYVAAAESPRVARRWMAFYLRRKLALPTALALYEDAIKADVGDRPSVFAAGSIALELGDRPRAKRHFDAYLASGDAKAASRLQIADVYAARGHTDRAQELYAATPPRGSAGQKARFHMWVRKGDLVRARAAAAAIVKAAPNPVVARVRLAATYLTGAGTPAALALELADAALSKRPRNEHPVALLVRAAALAELGRVPQAKKAFEALEKRGGLDLRALQAHTEPRIGQDDALVVLGRVGDDGGRLQSGPWEGYMNGARVFVRRAMDGRQIELVLWGLDKLRARDRGLRASAFAIATVRRGLTEVGGWSDAQRKQLSKLALTILDRVGTHWAAGMVVNARTELYAESGDLDAAIHTYRQAIRLFPTRADLHNNLAYLLANKGKHLDQALELVRQARKLSPQSDIAYLDTEGWVLHKLGRHAEAVAPLRAAIRLMSDTDVNALAETLYHLGLTYQALGRADEARAALGRAVGLGADRRIERLAKKRLELLRLP